MATARDNLTGGGFMALSMIGYGVNDAVVKLVAGQLPLGQILIVRGGFALVFIGLIAWYAGALRPLRVAFQKPILIRMGSEMATALFFLTAIINIPIANAVAILQVIPLTVTLGAALFLGEKVGIRRMIAILIGICGVLLVVRPGMEGFSIYSLFAVAAVFCASVRDLATRMIPKEVPSLFITLLTSFGVSLVGVFLMPFEVWGPVAMQDTSLLALAALFVLFGHFFIITALRRGDVAVIAPFRYSILIWAMLLGYFLLGEVPDVYTLVGAAIIAATGSFTLYREARLAARERAEA